MTPDEEKQDKAHREALKAVYEAKDFWARRDLYEKAFGTGTVAMVKGGTVEGDMEEGE